MEVGAGHPEHVRDRLHREPSFTGDGASHIGFFGRALSRLGGLRGPTGATVRLDLQDLDIQRLASKLALEFADALFELPDGSVAGDLVIVGHGDGSSLQH